VGGTRALGFPCFGRGVTPRAFLGRFTCVAANREVVCAGVRVRPGDLVVADADGVVVVPARYVERVLADGPGFAASIGAREGAG
jgi:regulator of RNase E activity RraA